MIDLHCHALPAVDDGPPTMEAAVAMARAHVEIGVDTVAATPHVAPEFANDAASIAAGVEALRGALSRAGVPLRVVTGAEIDLGLGVRIDDAELRALGLGSGPWLLVEAPLRLHPHTGTAVQELLVRGHRVLLAHPERSPVFHRDPELLRRLVADGARTQVTAGALVGRFGGTVQRHAEWLLEAGLLHSVASDAHDLERRPPGMRTELEAAGLGSRVSWLADEAPAAVLAGDDLAAPTTVSRRRFWPARGR